MLSYNLIALHFQLYSPCAGKPMVWYYKILTLPVQAEIPDIFYTWQVFYFF